MADTNLDGYMFFVGEGCYFDSKKERHFIGKIKGEAPVGKFKDYNAFQISKFSWRCGRDNDEQDAESELAVDEKKKTGQMPKLISPSTSTKTTVGGFSITKDVDIATPILFLASATRAKFPAAQVYFRKSSGSGPFTFFHMSFTDVVITEWSISFASGAPEENLSLFFNWSQLSYYPQAEDGTQQKDRAAISQFCPKVNPGSPPSSLREKYDL